MNDRLSTFGQNYDRHPPPPSDIRSKFYSPPFRTAQISSGGVDLFWNDPMWIIVISWVIKQIDKIMLFTQYGVFICNTLIRIEKLIYTGNTILFMVSGGVLWNAS